MDLEFMELGAVEEMSSLPNEDPEISAAETVEMILEQISPNSIEFYEEPSPNPVESQPTRSDPEGTEFIPPLSNTTRPHQNDHQREQHRQSSFGNRKNGHQGKLPAECQKKMATISLAMEIYQEIQYVKKKIQHFEAKCFDPEGRRLAIIIRRYSGDLVEGCYKIVASTQPIPRENSFIAQKYEDCLQLLCIDGLPDDGFSSSDEPEPGGQEDTDDTDIPASSSSSSTTSNDSDSDSDFIPPGCGRRL